MGADSRPVFFPSLMGMIAFRSTLSFADCGWAVGPASSLLLYVALTRRASP